ncbi:MAG: T9SS type A sorting domain-containing protein [bacterium]
MKKFSFPVLTVIAFFGVFLTSNAFGLAPTTHTITFGGTLGHHYYPTRISIEVGDTIYWNGDFATDNMSVLSIPAGATPINTVTSGNSFMYIVQAPGTYIVQNTTWANLGMRDTIIAVLKPHGSLTNEGREFYLGFFYPTYNRFVPSSLSNQFNVYALITSYYQDTLYISYYDDQGKEKSPLRQVINANQVLQYKLDLSQMLDTVPETQNVFKACHIVSKNPVSVQYLSRGANSGGSYMAFPVLALGKNYVLTSMYDNAGNGAFTAGTDATAAGCFYVIATKDGTSVSVTPSTTSAFPGHPKGRTFSFGLSKGQCYYLRADGKDNAHDITGTIVQSTEPIVVLSGHEDAYLGDISCYSAEGRNVMMQQSIPVEYWDSIGYMGIPFIEGTKGNSSCASNGDTYRVVTYDPGQSPVVQADITGLPGGVLLSTSQYNFSEKPDVTGAADVYSKNGKKISVIQYDQRTQTQNKPYPAATMLTLVPHSRWRKSYNFSIFNPSAFGGSVESQYINVISDSLSQVFVSVAGAPDQGFTNALNQSKTFNNISPNNFPSSKGGTFVITGKAFYVHSDFPFICYTYGMNEIQYSTGGGMMFQSHNFETEYATPAGMQLNTGAVSSLKVTTTELPNCAGWHVTVTDPNPTNPGVRAVMLLNDPDGVYFDKPASVASNVRFDPEAVGYTTLIDSTVARLPAELQPYWKSSEAYSFNVYINQPLAAAVAPLGFIDNQGNGMYVRLSRNAPSLKLLTRPTNSPDPNNIVFPQQTVGSQMCTTFVVRNTAVVGGSPMMFISAKTAKGDPTFSVTSTVPALPASIGPQDSLVVTLCSTLGDAKHHVDSLIIMNDCFTVPIALDARGATGTIVAQDVSYGCVDLGKELKKTFVVQNTGQAPFTLKPSPVLTDNVNFSIDQQFLSMLPVTIGAGKTSAPISVAFHPTTVTKLDSAAILWVTDIDGSFSNTGKNYTILRGCGNDTAHIGAVNGGSNSSNSLSVRPNPATGNSAFVKFEIPTQSNVSITIYDLLGREMLTQRYSTGSGEFELPIANLVKGVYYVRLTSNDIVLTQKLEVKR